MIGLCGAQRVGKSTLAKAFAEQTGVTFVATDASGVFSRLGVDPRVDYPLALRLKIQEAILADFDAQYAVAEGEYGTFITDRTPIDLAAYTLADITRGTTAGRPDLTSSTLDYVSRCMESASRFFGVIVLVQPGIALVDQPGKAPACMAHMEHINALAKGLLLDHRLHCRTYNIGREYTLLDSRVRALAKAVNTAAEYQRTVSSELVMH